MKRVNKSIAGLILTISAFSTAIGMQTPQHVYASTTPAMQKSNIIVDGQHFSTQYKFVYNDTTYMPIWYIMQALKKSGAQVSWNGSQWKIGVNGRFTPTVWHGFGGNGEVMIYNTSDPSNVQTVETGINMQVYPDPADEIKTTFFPIYDIQVILRDLGYTTDTWDGTNWSIAMKYVSSSSSTKVGWENPPLPSGVTQAQYNADVVKANWVGNNVIQDPPSGPIYDYSPLATATQWYNDPSDVFYNKQFPVSELKNGTVLQQNPYVIVTTTDGKNTNNMSYVYVLEYVGYGPNVGGGIQTYWKEEEVYTDTGKVGGVGTGIGSFMVAPTSVGGYPDLHKPSGVSGVYFPVINGTYGAPNPTWAAGGGTYTIPIQGWNPLK